jgi:hypothetical protein
MKNQTTPVRVQRAAAQGAHRLGRQSPAARVRFAAEAAIAPTAKCELSSDTRDIMKRITGHTRAGRVRATANSFLAVSIGGTGGNSDGSSCMKGLVTM